MSHFLFIFCQRKRLDKHELTGNIGESSVKPAAHLQSVGQWEEGAFFKWRRKAQSVNNGACNQNAFPLRAFPILPPALTSHHKLCFRHQFIIKSCKNRLRNICQHSAVRWHLHVFRTSFQITIRSFKSWPLWGKLASFFVVLTQHSPPSLIYHTWPPFFTGSAFGVSTWLQGSS